MSTYIYYGETLYHHGVKGQKWGLRKYQNEDGSLTAAGREHYGYGQARKTYKNKIDAANDEYRYARKETKRAIASLKKNRNTMSKDEYNEYLKEFKSYPSTSKKILKARKNAAKQEYKNSDEYKARQEKIKKAAKIGLAVAGTALAAYGAYKLSQAVKDKAYYKAYEKGESYASDLYKRNGVNGYTVFKDGTITLQNYFGETHTKAKQPKNDVEGYTAANLARKVNDAAWDEYTRQMRSVRSHANEVSKNTVSAAKYLIKNRKR